VKSFLTNAILALLAAAALFAVVNALGGRGERGFLDPPPTHIYNDP
jgi:hypothetical protein